MPVTDEQVKGVLDGIVDALHNDGWTEAKRSHYRKPGVPRAVEVGFTHGEVTVRIQSLRGEVDRGTLAIARGSKPEFVNQIWSALSSINDPAVDVTTIDGFTGVWN